MHGIALSGGVCLEALKKQTGEIERACLTGQGQLT
jgi:hypothetical protein